MYVLGWCGALTLVIASTVTATANAQEIEQITVTAERRETSLSDLSRSISVLTAADLRALGVNDSVELGEYMANMEVALPLGNAQPVFVVRGVGLQDFNINNNPAVGLYIDEIYQSSTAMSPFLMFDLERVEVLKGPQGTLYGRNTTGGAINILSRKPDAAFGGYLDTSYGNYQTIDVEGAVNLPVSEEFALRLSTKVQDRTGGHQFNRVTGRRHGELSTWATRATLNWTPSNTVKVSARVHGGQDKSDSFQFEHRGVFGPACRAVSEGIHDPNVCTDLLGYTDTDGDPYSGDYSRAPEQDDWFAGGVITANLDLPWGTATSITGYETFTYKRQSEEDASPATWLEIDYFSDIEQITQEFRLASKSDADWGWLAGAHFGRYRIDESRLARIDDVERFIGPIFGTNVTTLPYFQKTTTLAAFAQVDKDLSETLAVTGGLRLTDEKISYSGGTTLPEFGIPLVSVTDQIKEQSLTWDVGLEYRPDEEKLVYARISKGFKSGGFFGGFVFTPEELAPYDKERILAYEIGAKYTPATLPLQITGAAFYYDNDNTQAVFTKVTGNAGEIVTPTLGNLPGARIYGLETDIKWLVTPDFELNLSGGWLDSTIRGPSFNLASGGTNGPLFPLEGNRLPRAPELSTTARGIWTVRPAVDHALTFDASVNFRTKYHLDLTNLPMSTQPALATVNGRVTWSKEEASWQISAWVKNLTDKVVLLGDAPIGFAERDLVIYGMPRTFGVEVGLTF